MTGNLPPAAAVQTEACCFCAEPIAATVTDYEFQDGESVYHFHLRSYAIWQPAIARRGTDKEPLAAIQR